MKIVTFTILFIGLVAVETGYTYQTDNAEAVLGSITVTGGDVNYNNITVSTPLPETIQPWRPLKLTEVTGNGRRPVPLQIGQLNTDDHPQIWFPVTGTLEAGAERHYELSYGEPLQKDGIRMKVGEKDIRFERNGQTMFVYNHGHVIPPEGIDPDYIRSGYIHPVYSPAGLLVTEDFPSDHLHHKGVWFPWTRTEFEGRSVDFWNLGANEGTVQFAGISSIAAGPVFAGLRVQHEFVDLTQPDGGKTALDETWDLRAWSGNNEDFLWDLTSTQRTASESTLKLLEYRYGGLGFRGAKQWYDDNHVILTSEGHTKKDGHTERSRWIAHSGEIADGQWATVVIMVHPENKRFPEPMRIWADRGAFFCYSPVQLGDWTLQPGNDYTFRYRFWVYDGQIDAEKSEQMWQQFARPPEVTLHQ